MVTMLKPNMQARREDAAMPPAERASTKARHEDVAKLPSERTRENMKAQRQDAVKSPLPGSPWVERPKRLWHRAYDNP